MISSNTLERLKKEARYIGDETAIVEGKHDKQVLGELGFASIHEISGQQLHKFAESLGLAGLKSALILTDFDDDGERMNSQLTDLLQSDGIFVDTQMREVFKQISHVQRIEDIQIMKLPGDDYNSKTCSIYDKILSGSRFQMRRHGGEARRNRGDIRSD
jgi:5S rRNA maturation endonuclease (ribonuclease M5)